MNEHEIVNRTKKFIKDNLDSDLHLEKIANEAGYSKFHLNRIFAEHTGYTLYKYIQTKRLVQAAKELIETDKPVIEVALEANYQSQQAFTLAFKQKFYYPPQMYRNRQRLKMAKQAKSGVSMSMIGGLAA